MLRSATSDVVHPTLAGAENYVPCTQDIQYREAVAMLIREHPTEVIEGNTTYTVWICGAERPDGTWEAWLEFHPTELSQPILRTDQEISQPNHIALEYRAGGLEPVYLEGALARAQGRLL